jgi:hypothetical protein
VTIELTAKVTCDSCGAVLVVDESNLHARNAWLVAQARRWKYFRSSPEGDACPKCVDLIENPQKQLTLESV